MTSSNDVHLQPPILFTDTQDSINVFVYKELGVYIYIINDIHMTGQGFHSNNYYPYEALTYSQQCVGKTVEERCPLPIAEKTSFKPFNYYCQCDYGYLIFVSVQKCSADCVVPLASNSYCAAKTLAVTDNILPTWLLAIVIPCKLSASIQVFTAVW